MREMSAIILSGGFSSRMKTNKALLKIGDETIIELLLKKVSDFGEIMISTNHPEEYANLGVKTITDIIPQQGPMSGVHAGLTHSNYSHCLFVPCDIPFIGKEVLTYLAGLAAGYDVVVPKLGEKYQPLCAVYGKDCIEPIENGLNTGIHKITRIYPLLRTREVTEEEIRKFGNTEDMFRNINDPETYAKFCLSN